jgi:hypothetical protein
MVDGLILLNSCSAHQWSADLLLDRSAATGKPVGPLPKNRNTRRRKLAPKAAGLKATTCSKKIVGPLCPKQTLSDRLDYLAANYHLQAPALLLLLGVGLSSSPLLVWIAGALVLLSSLSLIYRKLLRNA